MVTTSRLRSAWTAHDFRGGHPALDFANTIGWRRGERPSEFLVDYADLVGWFRAAALLGDREALSLLAEAEGRPDDAAAVLSRARALRETIYRAFSARVAGRTPRKADLAALNTWVEGASSHRRLAARRGTVAWEWASPPAELGRMLWPLAWAAADLLTDDARGAVRECAGDGCGWLFLDSSKTGRRRWCSMSDCGNLAKVRRHRARRKGESSDPAATTARP